MRSLRRNYQAETKAGIITQPAKQELSPTSHWSGILPAFSGKYSTILFQVSLVKVRFIDILISSTADQTKPDHMIDSEAGKNDCLDFRYKIE